MAHAETTLRALLEKIAIEHRYDYAELETSELTTAICNFTTKLFRAKISAPNRADLKLIAKIAVFGEEMRQYGFKTLYATERVFYTQVARIYDWLQDKHNIQGYDRLILPKFFGCHPTLMEETVVLEDLGESGMQLWSKPTSVDWKYASRAVQEMAKLHALSFAYGVEEPEASKKLLEDLKYVSPLDEDKLHEYALLALEETKLVVPESIRERFVAFVLERMDFSVTSRFYQPVRKPALCHYDYKISNLMYKECSDGNLHFTPVDFQTVHTGCCLADLITFIFSSTDKEFRRRYFHRLVEWYYDQLCAALRRLGVEPDAVYTREDFDEELQLLLPYGLVVAVIYLPMMVASTEDASGMCEKNDLKEFLIKPTERYTRLLNDIIDDYIDWGILKVD